LNEARDILFEVKAYYKDQENLLATRQISAIYKGELAQYTIYQLEDFAKIKGADITFSRGGRIFSGSLTYSYMDAKGTGSSGREFYYRYQGTSLNPLKQEYPLEFDITHSVKARTNFYVPRGDSGSVMRWLGDANLNIVFSFASGTPYWGTDSKGNIIPLGSRRTPPTKRIDAKLEKWFTIGRRPASPRLGFYVDVTNIFDWKNVKQVYSNTGLPNDPGGRPVFEPVTYRDYEEDGFLSAEENWQADISDWEKYYAENPASYYTPRIINFGLRVNF
jgi:hypothetical protein